MPLRLCTPEKKAARSLARGVGSRGEERVTHLFFFLSSFSYRVTQDWMLVLVKDAKNNVALTLLT
jgi:hypothetical protein